MLQWRVATGGTFWCMRVKVLIHTCRLFVASFYRSLCLGGRASTRLGCGGLRRRQELVATHSGHERKNNRGSWLSRIALGIISCVLVSETLRAPSMHALAISLRIIPVNSYVMLCLHLCLLPPGRFFWIFTFVILFLGKAVEPVAAARSPPTLVS